MARTERCPSCSTGSHVTYLLGDEARESCSNEECDLYATLRDFDWREEKLRASADTAEDRFAESRFYERGEVDPW